MTDKMEIEVQGSGDESFYEKTVSHLHDGELIKGRIIAITKDTVMVDVGYKSEGQISIKEFLDAKGGIPVKVGDEIEIFLESSDDDRGHVRLSMEKANRLKMWETLEDAFNKGSFVEGKVTQRIKGGFSVDFCGINAFLPGSQLDLKPVANPEKLVNQCYSFKVLQFDRRKPNIVVSRRAALEEERAKQKESTIHMIEEGKVVDGVVKNITGYGVFVDLGGVDGLLHITDVSWGKTKTPSAIFKVGDRITVKVLKFNKEEKKISLGLKQLQPNPWDIAREKYQPGMVVKGAVVNIVDYGAFVELEDGLEGLVHLSELSWFKVKHPSQKVKAGDVIEAKIIEVDPVNKKIALSMKQLEANPWDTIDTKYPKGTKVKGIVKNITDFGVFIGIEKGIDGLLHVSDMSWKKVKHPSELFQKGQEIEAEVVNVDREKERLSLSMKTLQKDPWHGVEERYSPGMVLAGRVTNIADFGAFVELEGGVEGLVHVSELSRGKTKGINIKANDRVEVEVLNIYPEEKKIGLGFRKVLAAEGQTGT